MSQTQTIATAPPTHAYAKLGQPDFYNPTEEAKEFFKLETGIDDDEELKEHIVSVQRKAFKEYPYPCIRIFDFMELKIARLPNYGKLLEACKKPESIFLDLGCCFGNDTRRVIRDGVPPENVITSDLRAAFWTYGHELFRTNPSSPAAKVQFIPGDMTKSEFCEVKAPFTKDAPPQTKRPDDLHDVRTLNDVRGHVAGIYCGAFFHVFDEKTQAEVARKLAGILSPEPGSMLIGIHGAQKTPCIWNPTGTDRFMFCHSPESWTELWEGIFGKDNVEVTTTFKEQAGGLDLFGTYPGNKHQMYMMEWSVIRK